MLKYFWNIGENFFLILSTTRDFFAVPLSVFFWFFVVASLRSATEFTFPRRKAGTLSPTPARQRRPGQKSEIAIPPKKGIDNLLFFCPLLRSIF